MSVKVLDKPRFHAGILTAVSQDVGGTMRLLRRTNQERILTLLLAHGPLHRAGLARRAELSRTTVSTLISDLMARGLVVESDQRLSSADGDGRAREILAVNWAAAAVVGMNFTFNRVWVQVSDLAGQTVASGDTMLDTDLGPSERMEAGIGILERLLAEHGLRPDRIVGAGIGLPAPIHAGTGVAGVSLPGQPWSHVHAAEEFGRRLAMPVHIENCTRLEAMAEARWGAGQGVEELLYVALSNGVGSALILGGRPQRGAVGAAGELGHMSVNIDGPACPCGNRGCLVQYAGIPAVEAALRPAFTAQATLDEMLTHTIAGDRAGEGVFADVGAIVGRILANLCNLLNPERIVIGGELSRVGEPLLAPIRAAIRRYTLSLARGVEVVPAQLDLGVRAGALGGAALVRGDTAQLATALNQLAVR